MQHYDFCRLHWGCCCKCCRCGGCCNGCNVADIMVVIVVAIRKIEIKILPAFFIPFNHECMNAWWMFQELQAASFSCWWQSWNGIFSPGVTKKKCLTRRGVKILKRNYTCVHVRPWWTCVTRYSCHVWRSLLLGLLFPLYSQHRVESRENREQRTIYLKTFV